MNTNFKNLDVIQYSRTKLDTNTISVKDFGAKGDNTTDDYNAILNAIHYAISNNIKHIFFPDGKYKISSGFVFDSSNYDNLLLIGASRDAEIIVDSSLTTPIEAIFEITTNNAKRVQFERLTINCNNKANYAIKYSGINDAGEIKINNVRFENALKYAVDLGKLEDNKIIQCDFVDNARALRVAAFNGTNVITNTRFLQSTEFDVMMDGANHLRFIGCEFVDTIRQSRANICITGHTEGASTYRAKVLELLGCWIENKKSQSTNEGYNIWFADTNPDTLEIGMMPTEFNLILSGEVMSDTDIIHIDANPNSKIHISLPSLKIGTVGTIPNALVNFDGAGVHTDSSVYLGQITSDHNFTYLKPSIAYTKYVVRRFNSNAKIVIGKDLAIADFGPFTPATSTSGIAEALAFASQTRTSEPDSINKVVVEILDGLYSFDTDAKVSIPMEAGSRIIIKGRGERMTILEGHIDDYMLEFKTSDTVNNNDYGYLEIKGLTLINRGNVGTSNVNGLHTFHINSIKLDKVWIGGKLANINTDQLQAEGEAPANSIGLFLEGQGAEQVTTIDTLVSGFNIGYKINVDHLVMINPQARKIGNTGFWFGGGFDMLLLNPHGFQIGQTDINTSGMFYFSARPRHVTAINVHHEDHASWQSAQAPLINMAMDGQDFTIIRGYYSVTGNEPAKIIRAWNPWWANGITIKDFRIDESASAIYVIETMNPNEQKLITYDKIKLNFDTHLYGISGGVEHQTAEFIGDANLFGVTPLKVIYEKPNTSNTISNIETTYYSKLIEASRYGKFNAVIQLELKTLASLPIDQDITINIKYANSVVESRVVRPLQQTNAILPITIDTEFNAINTDQTFEITAVANNSDSNVQLTVKTVKIYAMRFT